MSASEKEQPSPRISLSEERLRTILAEGYVTREDLAADIAAVRARIEQVEVVLRERDEQTERRLRGEFTDALRALREEFKDALRDAVGGIKTQLDEQDKTLKWIYRFALLTLAGVVTALLTGHP